MSNFGHCALIGCLAFGAVAVTRIHVFNICVSISLIIGSRGLLEVCNGQSNFRKPCAVNLLVVLHLTLDHSFQVNLWWLSIKVPRLSRLLLVLEVCNVQSTFSKPLAANLRREKTDLRQRSCSNCIS